MSFAPASLLVTGGAGFIGANFVRHWLARSGAGPVVVLDALTYAGNPDSLSGLQDDARYRFVRGDICDEALVSELLAAHSVDTIVNFAAESHVDRSILGPDDFIRTNVIGTHSLLKAARRHWLGAGEAKGHSSKTAKPHRFHHVSTDEVYGSLTPSAPAFTESSPYAPNSPYSASKAASDHLVRAYHHTYGVATTITNCSNNYGPYQFPEKLIPLSIVNILLGKPLPIYGDGRQIRDWLHVQDHCIAIEAALRRGEPGHTYNIGGDAEIANIELVRMLCSTADRAFAADEGLRQRFPQSPSAASGRASSELIQFVRDRPGHDRRYAVDFRLAARELGFAPAQTLKAGIESALHWYLGNEPWWRAILGRDFDQWMQRNYGDGEQRPSGQAIMRDRNG